MKELVFGHRYRATEKIGSGGMADVYKAVDEVLGRTVAVKVMHAQFAADPSFAARFRQEAQAAANLVSPNIVHMYDWGQDAETYYIVMEYVRGSDLKAIIEEKGALPSRTVAEIGAQVCSALSVAHGYDVIHRDIKPHNIMVQPDGAVKVMDFGIARTGPSMMTQTGSVLGTAQYLSPEQAQGQPLTAASDLYSLGVVLYEAATGRLPFDADSPVAVALKQVNEQAVVPHVANPDIDLRLDAVIVKAMQKKTADRYVSADDLRKDLRAVEQGRPVDAAPYAGAAAGMTSHGDDPAGLPHVDKTAVMPRAGLSEDSASGGRARPRSVPKRRRVWPWIVLVALLVAAGLGVAWNRGLFDTHRTDLPPIQSAPVPDVTSKARGDARTALQNAGFTVGDITYKFSARVRSGRVISQSPAPGATAVRGSAINLVVSKGPETVPVPNVVGIPEIDAFKALEAAGFTPQALAPEFNSEVPSGTVFAQTPAGNEKAVKGTPVTYVVSLGAESFVTPGRSGKNGKSGKWKDSSEHD